MSARGRDENESFRTVNSWRKIRMMQHLPLSTFGGSLRRGAELVFLCGCVSVEAWTGPFSILTLRRTASKVQETKTGTNPLLVDKLDV